MRVFELDGGDGGVLGEVLRRRRQLEAPRTGLHVSTIIQDLLRTSDPKTYAQEFDPNTSLAFQEIGNALEDVVARELRRRVPGWVKPEPGIYHGVHFSPDGWRHRTRAVDEIKCCWKSERDFIALHGDGTVDVLRSSLKLQGYLWQLLFYMRALRARRGHLHVLFVAGNYRPPFPIAHTYTFVPTQDELIANERLLLQHAKDRRMLK